MKKGNGKIILHEVGVRKYEEFERVWGDRKIKYNDSIYSLILNPVSAGSYREMMGFLLELENANLICVRKGKSEWVKRYVRDLLLMDSSRRERELDMLARTAEKDLIKKNYFEVKIVDSDLIQFNNSSFKGIKNKRKNGAVIEFSEYSNKIIGYKVLVPARASHLFEVRNVPNSRENYVYNNGLWVPANYREIPAIVRNGRGSKLEGTLQG